MSGTPHILIRGMGLITPLGMTTADTFEALCQGRTLADRACAGDVVHSPLTQAQALGRVPWHLSDTIGNQRQSQPAQLKTPDPAVLLARHAITQACHMAHTSSRGLGCLVGASKGAIRYLAEDPCVFALGPQGYLGWQLQRGLDLSWIRNVAAACASGLYALHEARQLLRAGRAKQLLVVSSEAALTAMFFGGYRRLGVLADQPPHGVGALPLDHQRQGFVLAQTGVAVLLQAVGSGELTEEAMAGQIELTDTQVACDGYDMIRTSPHLPALGHIADRLIGTGQIDLLHPHATGTVQHDASELALYRQRQPNADVYACKGAVGHTLGASGLVSLVLACWCAKTGQRPPMPWLTEPIDPVLQAKAQTGTYRRQAVFAAGFGGTVAGAVIEHHPQGPLSV